MSTLLQATKLNMVFGGLRAVTDFSLTLEDNELVGLIGPNGAGKTTVFNMLTGVYTPTTGSIQLLNPKGKMQDTTRYSSHRITWLGVARTFQNIRLFKNQSVYDNVAIARHFRVKYTPMEAVLRLPRFFQEEENTRREILDLLAIFKIDHKAQMDASSLPYGEQRKLEIVRALATKPRILLLDEPAAGMNPQETHELMELIAFIRQKFQITILLIEHDMHLVMNVCQRLLVLDYGRTIAQGIPDQIKRDPQVIKAYLGED